MTEGNGREGVVAEEEGDDVNLIKRMDRIQNENAELRKAAVRQSAMLAALVGILVANGTITREDALLVVQAGVDDTDEMTDPKRVIRWLRHEILQGRVRRRD